MPIVPDCATQATTGDSVDPREVVELARVKLSEIVVKATSS
jgi:hypothetical protein